MTENEEKQPGRKKSIRRFLPSPAYMVPVYMAPLGLLIGLTDSEALKEAYGALQNLVSYYNIAHLGINSLYRVQTIVKEKDFDFRHSWMNKGEDADSLLKDFETIFSIYKEEEDYYLSKIKMGREEIANFGVFSKAMGDAWCKSKGISSLDELLETFTPDIIDEVSSVTRIDRGTTSEVKKIRKGDYLYLPPAFVKGIYHPANRKCRIKIGKHDSIYEVVEVAAHEVAHDMYCTESEAEAVSREVLYRLDDRIVGSGLYAARIDLSETLRFIELKEKKFPSYIKNGYNLKDDIIKSKGIDNVIMGKYRETNMLLLITTIRASLVGLAMRYKFDAMPSILSGFALALMLEIPPARKFIGSRLMTDYIGIIGGVSSYEFGGYLARKRYAASRNITSPPA